MSTTHAPARRTSFMDASSTAGSRRPSVVDGTGSSQAGQAGLPRSRAGSMTSSSFNPGGGGFNVARLGLSLKPLTPINRDDHQQARGSPTVTSITPVEPSGNKIAATSPFPASGVRPHALARRSSLAGSLAGAATARIFDDATGGPLQPGYADPRYVPAEHPVHLDAPIHPGSFPARTAGKLARAASFHSSTGTTPSSYYAGVPSPSHGRRESAASRPPTSVAGEGYAARRWSVAPGKGGAGRPSESRSHSPQQSKWARRPSEVAREPSAMLGRRLSMAGVESEAVSESSMLPNIASPSRAGADRYKIPNFPFASFTSSHARFNELLYPPAPKAWEEMTHEERVEKIGSDAQSFLKALRDLRSEGGAGLGPKLDDVWNALKVAPEEIKEVSGVNSLQTRQAAHMLVLVDDLADQLKEVTLLLLSEPDFKDIMTSFVSALKTALTGLPSLSPFQRVYTPVPAPASPGEAISAAIASLRAKLTGSPVYLSILLRSIDTIAQLLTLSSYTRLTLINGLVERLFDTSSLPDGNSSSAKFARGLHSLREMVEQLSGVPVRPFVRAIAAFFTYVDPAVEAVAKDTHDFLANPLPPSVDVDGDRAAPVFERHPLGYVYAPLETSHRLAILVEGWSAALLQSEPQRSALATILEQWERISAGLLGNSRVAKLLRDSKRLMEDFVVIKEDGELAFRTGSLAEVVEAIRALAKDAVSINLAKIETSNDGYEYTLDEIQLSAEDVVPARISVQTDSSLDLASKSPSLGASNSVVIKLQGIVLDAKNVRFTYKRKGFVDMAENGTLDMHIKADIDLALSPSFSNTPNSSPSTVKQALAKWAEGLGLGFGGFGAGLVLDGVDVKVESEEINIRETTSVFSKLLWPLAKGYIAGETKEVIESWVRRVVEPWTSAPSPTPSSDAPTAVPAEQGVDKQQGVSTTVSRQPSIGGFTPGTAIAAREAFRRAVGSVPHLRGDVLSKLENPFSSQPPSSYAREGEEQAPAQPRKRLQSMSASLTTTAKQDTTGEEAIRRPPVATPSYENAVFDDDEEPEFKTMGRSLSETARRDTTTAHSIYNPPIDPHGDAASRMQAYSHRGSRSSIPYYDEREFYLSTEEQHGYAPASHRPPPSSMSHVLSDEASRDATLPEHIASPPRVSKGDVAEKMFGREGGGRGYSMMRATLDLSGLPDPEDAHGDGLDIEGREHRRPPLTEEFHHRDIRRSIGEEATQDMTTAEAEIAYHRRHHSQPGEEQPPVKVEPMSRRLSMAAKADGTLEENIVSPSASRPVSRASSLSYHGGGRRGSRTSFTGLRPQEMVPMNATVDENETRDTTDPSAPSKYAKMRRPSETQAGLSDVDTRRKSMSELWKASAKGPAGMDATDVRNIASPPVVEKELLTTTSDEQEHLQRANPLLRRGSSVGR